MSPHHSPVSLGAPSTVSIPLLPHLALETAAETRLSSTTDKESYWVDFAVAGGIVALLLGLLMLAVGRQDTTLPYVKRSLVGHLRFTQAGALSRGAHFRVTFQQHAYIIEQLQDNDSDGIWSTDATLPTWRIALPETVMIETGGTQVVEFDNHGLVTGQQPHQNGKLLIRVRDVRNGRVETLHVLSSGQVREA